MMVSTVRQVAPCRHIGSLRRPVVYTPPAILVIVVVLAKLVPGLELYLRLGG